MSFPRNAKDEVRAMTLSPGILASRFRISSASPSLKYSFSLSALDWLQGRHGAGFARLPDFAHAALAEFGEQLIRPESVP